MSMRAAIHPSPKKSGKPRSHQYSNSISERRRRDRRLDRAAAALQRGDVSALAKDGGEHGEDAEQRAGREGAEQQHDERRSERPVEVEAQRDRVYVLRRERDEQ